MSEELNIVNIGNYMEFYKEKDEEKDEEKEHSPICREERQYALYLSNVLRYYGKDSNRIENNEKVKNIFKACGFNDVDLKNIVIENVFYEATFMRDFFERNRRYHLAVKDGKKLEDEYSKIRFAHKDYMVATKNSFNYKLLVYCSNSNIINKTPDKTSDQINNPIDAIISERNYGGNNNFIGESKPKKSNDGELKFKELCEEEERIFKEIKINKDDKKWNKFKTFVRAMMNAKPDLAVIYTNKERNIRKLLFIECKYCSNEDSYENRKNGNNNEQIELSQTKVQGYIADFLCGSYLEGVEMSEIMKNNNNESRIIRFVADSEKDEETQSKNGQTKNKQTKEGQISIKDLIETEEAIFN